MILQPDSISYAADSIYRLQVMLSSDESLARGLFAAIQAKIFRKEEIKLSLYSVCNCICNKHMLPCDDKNNGLSDTSCGLSLLASCKNYSLIL